MSPRLGRVTTAFPCERESVLRGSGFGHAPQCSVSRLLPAEAIEAWIGTPHVPWRASHIHRFSSRISRRPARSSSGSDMASPYREDETEILTTADGSSAKQQSPRRRASSRLARKAAVAAHAVLIRGQVIEGRTGCIAQSGRGAMGSTGRAGHSMGATGRDGRMLGEHAEGSNPMARLRQRRQGSYDFDGPSTYRPQTSVVQPRLRREDARLCSFGRRTSAVSSLTHYRSGGRSGSHAC